MSLQTARALYDFAMKTGLPSWSICGLILILLPLTFSTSHAAHKSSRSGCTYFRQKSTESIPNWWEKTFFEPFYRNESDKTDTNNPSIKRTVQLYSRASHLHVQIKKKELDARGRHGSEYARLVLESDNFGRVKIRGEKTNRYLCLNKKGELVTRVKKSSSIEMKRCIFKQEVTAKGYFEYRSTKYPQWLIGFSKGGRPVSGCRSAMRPIYRQFTHRKLPEWIRQKHRRDAKRRMRLIRLLRRKFRLR